MENSSNATFGFYLAPFEDMIVSPRASDQRLRTSNTSIQSVDTVDDLDVQGDVNQVKDQSRRKPRFSTSSLPDIDW